MDFPPIERSDPDSNTLRAAGCRHPRDGIYRQARACDAGADPVRGGAGRMIIPANIHHTNLEPMCIGVASACKINANIGNSSTTSNIDEEVAKLHYAVKFGADTVMDLSTGGDIPRIRQAIINERSEERRVGKEC